MRLSRYAAVLALAIAASGSLLPSCAATPPPHWATGGARLAIAPATWTRPGVVVEIRSDGTVLEGDHVVFSLDSVGRVYDRDNAPIALLAPDGVVEGTDGEVLGDVGEVTASLPGRKFAWLGLSPTGALVRYSPEGVRTQDGVWKGCDGAMTRTCVLVSHMIALAEWRSRPRASVGLGMGFGFGMGIPLP